MNNEEGAEFFTPSLDLVQNKDTSHGGRGAPMYPSDPLPLKSYKHLCFSTEVGFWSEQLLDHRRQGAF